MNNEEKLSTCMVFRDRMITMLKEMSDMAQCIIPLNGDDRKILCDGIDEIDKFVNSLEKAETLRDLNQFMDVNAYISQSEEIDSSMEQATTHQKFAGFMESIERMASGDE